MNNIHEGFPGVAVGITPSCLVAYTINNQQPVISTLIGEQPFFYMDMGPEEEMMDLDDDDMDLLAGELEKLKREIEVYDRLSSHIEDKDSDVFEKFLDNKEDYEETSKTDKASDIESLLEILSSSRTCQDYLKLAEKHDVKIIHSAQCEDAHYDRAAKIISINPNILIEEQALLATRELRRHWQHRQGAMINPLTFDPDNAILVNRVQIADLSASMIRAAWEMQLSGHKNIWERIEFSPMADLGRAFAREAFLDFRTLNNGMATTAVFEAWFLSERCLHADRNLVKAMLADQGGHTFSLEGHSRNVTPSLIAAVGEMPFGKNYLAPHVYTIMEDSIFCDVRDRSNANFLWFIKFERSFRETEQELQANKELNTHGEFDTVSDRNNHSETSRSQSQDLNYGTQPVFSNRQDQNQAQIVELFPGALDAADSSKKSRPLSKRSKNNSGISADIIDLRSRS